MEIASASKRAGERCRVGETTTAYRMQTGVGNVRATTTVKSGYSADEKRRYRHSFSNKYLPSRDVVFARERERRRRQQTRRQIVRSAFSAADNVV